MWTRSGGWQRVDLMLSQGRSTTRGVGVQGTSLGGHGGGRGWVCDRRDSGVPETRDKGTDPVKVGL